MDADKSNWMNDSFHPCPSVQSVAKFFFRMSINDH